MVAAQNVSSDPVRAFFRVLWQGKTYRRMLYLLSSFPLGIFYFTVLITGFSVGISTAIIIIGIPLLVLLVIFWYGFAFFERELAIWWLDVDIPPMAPTVTVRRRWLDRLREHLRNPVTWKSLLFLIAKFPLGIFAFTFVLVALSLSLVFVFEPIIYVLSLAVHQSLSMTEPTYLISLLSGLISVGGTFVLGDFIQTFTLVPVGLIMLLLTFHLINVSGWAWGEFARVTLGMSEVEMRLAEARAMASQERARAQRAEQGRRELIVNVGHELRTPIASIRGHVESLMIATEHGNPPGSEELQSYLHIVNREAERLGSLVDELLTLARSDAGELHLSITIVQPATVADEVYQSLAPLAQRERTITIVQGIPATIPAVYADRERLVQVLLNLVRNAITYTPAGGIVSLSAELPDANHVALVVSDTGMGISPEEQAHIFERFYRTDASRSRSTGGFGLGLAIVRDLVYAMGGSITVSSTSGEGSQFRVILQRAKEVG
jgi:two-component system, OmpR family, phosphate regulon sensor histidine kinase PhoR